MLLHTAGQLLDGIVEGVDGQLDSWLPDVQLLGHVQDLAAEDVGDLVDPSKILSFLFDECGLAPCFHRTRHGGQ